MASAMPNQPEPRTRIIGVELRLCTPWGEREEICLLSCDVEIPASVNATMPYELDATVHTTMGDANFPVRARMPFGQMHMPARGK